MKFSRKMARSGGPEPDFQSPEILRKLIEYLGFWRVFPIVKANTTILRLSALSLLVACVASSVSCMTTYDAYGRPVQSVHPHWR